MTSRRQRSYTVTADVPTQGTLGVVQVVTAGLFRDMNVCVTTEVVTVGGIIVEDSVRNNSKIDIMSDDDKTVCTYRLRAYLTFLSFPGLFRLLFPVFSYLLRISAVEL